MHRRFLLSRLALAALVGPGAAGVVPLPVWASGEEAGDCGCGGPKSKPAGQAERLYREALTEDDPARRQRLLELALRLDPDHQGARQALSDDR